VVSLQNFFQPKLCIVRISDVVHAQHISSFFIRKKEVIDLITWAVKGNITSYNLIHPVSLCLKQSEIFLTT
jgi:hypothetical protein